MSNRNPFPGLRPFEYHEYELFFGRDEQYEEMIAKLSETRFLAVVGTSGSGKSSVVKAGLYPALYGGLMMSAGPSWRIAEFRPKDDPIRELALALNHKRVFGDRSKENGSSLFRLSESTDWAALCSRINRKAKEEEPNPSRRIVKVLSSDNRDVLSGITSEADVKDPSKIVKVFNGLLKTRDLYQPSDFKGVPLSSEIEDLLKQDQKSLTDEEVAKLNRLVLEASFPHEIAKKMETQAQITEVTLRRGDLGLIEVVREAKMSLGENLLIVVDQFEELFRYAKISEHGPHGNQAAAFVKLLLEASAQTELPIHVVLTMRSDYLGDCAKFWGLPEAINKGQYLIPRLTRDQRREAITGPIELRGAQITPRLVNQLLNDMGDDPDQLPILQHALMRTWDRWEKDHEGDELIDLRHYDAIGRMAEALSKHADEAYNELPDERSREIAQQMFRCLTERGRGRLEIRRPTRLREMLVITDTKFRELVSVIDVFRKEGRSFLLPPSRKTLRRDSLIDISHESLIRNWQRLKGWVKDEAESADTYRRLVQSARLYEQDQAGLLTDLEIEHASRWKNINKPNVAWASRYHLDFARVHTTVSNKTNGQPMCLSDDEIFKGAMGFLEKSQLASRRKARIRKLTKALVAASVLLVVAIVALWLEGRKERLQSQDKARLAYSAEMKLAQRELEAGNYAEVNRLLHERANRRAVPGNLVERLIERFLYPPVDEKLLHGFEWHHLWKLSHSESKTVGTYDSPIASLEYLNRSSTLAVTQRNGQVVLWDVQSNSSTNLSGAPENILFVAFSADRKTVVIAQQNGSIALWELPADSTNLRYKRRLRPAQSLPLISLAYSPDNRFVAAGTQDGGVAVWLTDGSNEPIYTTATQNSNKVPLAFSADSRWLAVGFNQNAKIVDLGTRGEEQIDLSRIQDKNSQAPQSPAPITCLAFSPDGKTLAMGRRDATIAFWDLDQKRHLTSVKGHSQEILKILFSDQGTGVLASASRDGAITIWNAKKFSDREFWKNLSQNNLPAEPNVEDRIKNELLVTALYGHTEPVTSLAFTGDGKTVVSGSDDKSLRIWSIDPQPTGTYVLGSAPSKVISSLAFSHNGGWLAAGRDDGSTTVWNLSQKPSEGIVLHKAEQHTPDKGNETPVAFSTNQILAASTGNSDVTLWQVSHENLKLRTLSGRHHRRVLALAFSNDDGKWLATGGADNKVWIWEVATGNSRPVPFGENSNAVLSLAFAPNSRVLAIGTTNNTVLLWNLDTNETIKLEGEHTGPVTSIAFSADGSTMATGSWDTTVQLWDTHTHKRVATLQGPQKVLSLAFFPDGKRLVAAGEDGSVRLWDSDRESSQKDPRNALLALLGEGVTPAFSVAVSADGSTFASGNADGTVMLRYGATRD